ncbi:hemerythrin domain-containing protein [Burkholderia diffusa]|uniref:hemerythrin domain-containing protein n=1 Tax=Burkholderia diffusa TaxID=488732 RepID=UPI002AB1294E|nr:hemerythrin domain-containing protein [Burkholderia diffusa]
MPSLRSSSAITVILHEHDQLSTVIEGMRRFVHLLVAGAPVPGLMVFRAMLYYIREYPQQVHHPKEDRYLFGPLRDRTDEFDGVLDELESQHDRGDAKLRDLEHALTRYELKGGTSALRTLGALVDDYAEFYADHRCLEETLILPAAKRLLTLADWAEIDAAFGANHDPFDGSMLEDDLGKLFSMIVNTIPEQEASCAVASIEGRSTT